MDISDHQLKFICKEIVEDLLGYKKTKCRCILIVTFRETVFLVVTFRETVFAGGLNSKMALLNPAKSCVRKKGQ